MATKLKNLTVRQIGLVDRGANQEAMIALAKRDDTNDPPEALMGRSTDFLKWCAEHRDGTASIRSAADDATSLDELRKRADQPLTLIKADVQSRIGAELERRREAAGFPSDPKVLGRLLRDLLAEPIDGPWRHVLDPSQPPRPTWGDVLNGAAEDPDQQRSLQKAANDEQRSLAELEAIARRLRAGDPRVTPAKSMSLARDTREGREIYGRYVEAQRARRLAGRDS